MAGTATPATVLLDKSKTPHRVHSYDHDPRAESFGDEAVTALAESTGVEAARSSRPWSSNSTPASSPSRSCRSRTSSRSKLQPLLGASKAVMADRAEAERSSGYVFGGISPLGQRKKLRQ